MTTRRDRVLLAALLAWVFTPLAILILRAVAQSWRFPRIAPDAGDVWPALAAASSGRLSAALLVTLALAIASGLIGTIIGFAIARTATHATVRARQLTLAAAFFTVIAPPLALGVGLQVALLGVGLGGTFAGVLLAHLVPVTGYLTLFALGVFSSLDPSLEDEARTLGASRWQVVSRVLAPLLGGRVREALVLGGLVSWGQVALTLVVGGGLVRTLPVELMSIVQSGNDRIAAIAALMLSLPPMFAIGLLTVSVRRTGASIG
jgi:putative spermidine/putrescine transport system permease protein